MIDRITKALLGKMKGEEMANEKERSFREYMQGGFVAYQALLHQLIEQAKEANHVDYGYLVAAVTNLHISEEGNVLITSQRISLPISEIPSEHFLKGFSEAVGNLSKRLR